ncbi:class I SAM-dependent methyltransferase [Paenibacillus sp. TRM 82003]|nr:class I SAM-dependent methyltransferase [Paenibacillus sp. TRM 82003]
MPVNTETIHSTEELLRMLDALFRDEGLWWDRFYENRGKAIPFFVDAPDENLVRYFATGAAAPGKVLELGCGPGRNATYMSGIGCEVDAVDVSEEAIRWAEERARAKNVQVNFIRTNVFDLAVPAESYDLIYDCGCFHHIFPHRRLSYVDLVTHALKPGGLFGLVCFAAGAMGADLTDWAVYRERSLKGGLGYSEEKLAAIFRAFEPIELRRMRSVEQPSDVFGESFLWTALFRKGRLPPE